MGVKASQETEIVEPRGIHLSTVISPRPVIPGIPLSLTGMLMGGGVGTAQELATSRSQIAYRLPLVATKDPECRWRGPLECLIELSPGPISS